MKLIINLIIVFIFSSCKESTKHEIMYLGRIDFAVPGHVSGTYMIPVDYSWNQENEEYILSGNNEDIGIIIGFETNPEDIISFPFTQNCRGVISGIGEEYSTASDTESFTISNRQQSNSLIDGSFSFTGQSLLDTSHVVNVSGTFSGVPLKIE